MAPIAPASGDAPMSYKEFKAKVKGGALSRDELRRCIRFDRAGTVFAPSISLNPKMVDDGGKPPTPAQLFDLLRDWKEREKPTATAFEKAAAGPKWLAEGDSWFRLGCFSYPPSGMDIAGKTQAILNLALPGDILTKMIARKDYRAPLCAGTLSPFFFSGGGNDVLDRLDKHIRRRKPGQNDPDHYIKPSFDGELDRVMELYGELLDDKRQFAGNTLPLIVHGYGNAIPKKNGKYLGKPLQELGFDPVAETALCKAIVAGMIDRFNKRLEEFARPADVAYIDLRPVLVAKEDWHTDEIHPSLKGATKIAARLKAEAVRFIPVA